MESDGLGGCYGIDQVESELIDRMVLVRKIEKLTKELETTKKTLVDNEQFWQFKRTELLQELETTKKLLDEAKNILIFARQFGEECFDEHRYTSAKNLWYDSEEFLAKLSKEGGE